MELVDVVGTFETDETEAMLDQVDLVENEELEKDGADEVVAMTALVLVEDE